MKKLHVLVAAAFIFSLVGAQGAGASGENAAPTAAIPDAQGMPEGLLNPDGTLNLEQGFSGALNLSGWDVGVDAERGPVFSPSGEVTAAPLSAPAYGHWGGMGGGGGGAVSSTVLAVAVMGTRVFVGGYLLDVNNIEGADMLAEWTGSNWAAVSTGFAGGSLTSTVFALAVDGTDLYAAGCFYNVNDNGTIIPEADYIAKWDTGGHAWSALGSNGSGDGALNGCVRALAVDPATDDVYAGGTFQNAGGIAAADYLAKWNGSSWSALGSYSGNGALNHYVNALAWNGTDLYAGGSFTDGAGIGAADYVAKWNGAWSALGSDLGGDGSIDGWVHALALDGANVYVGGWFLDVEDATYGTLGAADFIAQWNGTRWSALGGTGGATPNGSLNAGVRSIAVSASHVVYAGGDFTNVKNAGTTIGEADYVAKWSGGNWSALGGNAAGNGSLQEKVYALALGVADLYVGGAFGHVNDAGTRLGTAAHFAKWNETTHWSGFGAMQGSITGSVFAITVSGTNVYVGGDFMDVANRGTPLPSADYIAKWDGANWSALGSNGAGNGALNGAVHAIVVYGTNVYVGGYFFDAGGVSTADFVAKWNGGTWSGLGSDGAGDGALPTFVTALAVNATGVYVGGYFEDAAGNPAADDVAFWNGSTWTNLGDNGFGDGALKGGSVHFVNALALDSTGKLYVGGYFENAAGNAKADYVAKWNGTSWSALGSNLAGTNGALSGPVMALAAAGTTVYAGGGFTNAAGNARADFVAKWNGTNWSNLGGTGTDGALTFEVYAISAVGSDVYAAGTFSDVRNGSTTLTNADRVAKWNGSKWSALGTGLAGEGSIAHPSWTYLMAVAATKRQVYVGGFFYNVQDGSTTLKYADYVAVYSNVPKTTTVRSVGFNDGWVLESGENTSVGGTMNSTAAAFRLGDSAARQQYRSILHFNTSALPDTASIAAIKLKIMKQAQTGGNPFNTLGSIKVDIKKGTFGTAVLELGDFQATAGANNVGTISSSAYSGGWYSTNLSSAAYSRINLSGVTQLRLGFGTGDNNNPTADYLSFYSGNAATTSYRPLLTITYFP